jgi:hypothetical protein
MYAFLEKRITCFWEKQDLFYANTPQHNFAGWCNIFNDEPARKPMSVEEANARIPFYRWILYYESELELKQTIDRKLNLIPLVELPPNPRDVTNALIQEMGLKNFTLEQEIDRTRIQQIVNDKLCIYRDKYMTKVSDQQFTEVLVEINERLEVEMEEWVAYEEALRYNAGKQWLNDATTKTNHKLEAAERELKENHKRIFTIVNTFLREQKQQRENLHLRV